MQSKWGTKAKRSEKVDQQRRKVIKLMGAAGAGAIASPWMFQSSRAASKTIKIGMVTPETGPIAAFGEPSQWVAAGVRKQLADGITVAGQKYNVEIITKDSQSNPNRASEVTAQLINNDKVDIMTGSSTSDTVNPVSDQCELAGVPCITSDDPWQAWFFPRKGDPKKGFEWTYHFFWGFDMIGNTFVDMWETLPTNKVVATLFTNDPDGIGASDKERGLPALFRSKGYDVHELGLYPPLSDDFSSQIAEMKKASADIVCGIFNPPQFATFWTQCAQQGFKPKIVTPPKAVLFPTAVEALGERGVGISTEVWWSHHHPLKSPERRHRAAILRCLREGDRQAVDPAARLQTGQSGSGDRRAQARQEARADCDPRRHRPDRLSFDRRSADLEGRAAEPGAECVHHPARRRAMEEGQEVQVRSGNRLQQDGAQHSARQRVRGD
jgi:branched-chain amino acid transport system substrate-binding protein